MLSAHIGQNLHGHRHGGDRQADADKKHLCQLVGGVGEIVPAQSQAQSERHGRTEKRHRYRFQGGIGEFLRGQLEPGFEHEKKNRQIRDQSEGVVVADVRQKGETVSVMPGEHADENSGGDLADQRGLPRQVGDFSETAGEKQKNQQNEEHFHSCENSKMSTNQGRDRSAWMFRAKNLGQRSGDQLVSRRGESLGETG